MKANIPHINFNGQAPGEINSFLDTTFTNQFKDYYHVCFLNST